MAAVLAAVCATGAVLLARPARTSVLWPSPTGAASTALPQEGGRDSGMRRWRLPLCLLAGVGAALFVSGPAGPVAGLLAAVATWVAIDRLEDPGARRDRLAAEADLPHLVLLFAAALRGGAPPSSALAVVCAALPGPAADRLEGVRARLYLGVDPVEVWDVLADDPVLAPLARTMARAARSGARVADAVDRLSVDLARQARARSEDRARTVGVRAAVPLGLCLLPAFLLIGIVPVVAGLMTQLTP
jgi:Flp pilus assembly protein TadB